MRAQRAQVVGQHLWQHRNRPVHEVHTRGTAHGLPVQHRAWLQVMRNVRDVDADLVAALAVGAALQLDGDTFSASTGGDSLLGMLAPAAGQDDPGTEVRSAFSTFGTEPPSSSQATDRNLQGVYGSSAAAPGTWESGSNWNNGMHGTATSWSTWGAG